MTGTQTDTTKDDAQNADHQLARTRRAYNALGDALQDVSLVDDEDMYFALQQQYFKLKARMRALDPDFQDDSSLEGRNVTTHPDYDGDGSYHASVLSQVTVCDPKNAHTTHSVHVDHVVDSGGDVRVEVNGVALADVGSEKGSYIR